jgi:CheY-like chemotaxis protein
VAEERLLLVEDEADQRHLVAALLGGAGYPVAETASAEEALAELERSPVDLVLSDWKLPGRDGLSLLAESKRPPAESARP